MRDNIVGKSILLICDPFYGYGQIMKDTLLKIGAKSVCYKEATFYSGSLRDKISFRSILSWIKNPKRRAEWTRRFIKEIAGLHFDTFFVVENMPFSLYFFDYLKKANPQVRSILFLWDTTKTQQPRYTDFYKKFDTVYSFDRDDAKKYGFKYYPDFYIPEEIVPISRCEYDVAFVGSMSHGETKLRAKILFDIYNFCQTNNLHSFIYLKHFKLANTTLRKIYQMFQDFSYVRMVKKYKKYGYLYDQPLPIEQYNRVMAQTKVVIDLSYHRRQGMTINAITALACGKKLITTNNRIKKESFYNPSIILVVDERSPQLDMNFIQAPYSSADFSHLQIDNWLRHVVNEQ